MSSAHQPQQSANSPRGITWPAEMTWLVGLGTAIGYANTAAQSWIDAALIKHKGLTIEQAGWVVSLESLAMAIAMIVFAPIVVRANRKLLFLCALGGVIGFQFLSVVASGFWMHAISRGGSGIVFGLLYTIAIANGAASATPQRTFAGAAAVALIVGTLFHPLMGFGGDLLGYAGVPLGLAVYVCVFGLPLLFINFGGRVADGPPTITNTGVPMNVGAAVAVLCVMGLLTIATNGTLLFMVQIGDKIGLKGSALGSGLALVSLLSALGGVAASQLGQRLGKIVPIAGGLALMGLSVVLLASATAQPIFWVSVTTIVALFWFLNSYILGLSVEVDPEGRLAPITASVKILFSAVAGTIASGVAAQFGIPAVGILGLFVCGLAIILSIGLIRYLRQREIPA